MLKAARSVDLNPHYGAIILVNKHHSTNSVKVSKLHSVTSSKEDKNDQLQKNYSFILFIIEVSEFKLQFVFYQIRKLLFLRDSKWQRVRTSILNYNFHVHDVSRVKFAISEIVIILTYMCYVMVKLHRGQIHGTKRVCEICPLMALLCLNNSHRRNGILLKMKSKNKLMAL